MSSISAAVVGRSCGKAAIGFQLHGHEHRRNIAASFHAPLPCRRSLFSKLTAFPFRFVPPIGAMWISPSFSRAGGAEEPSPGQRPGYLFRKIVRPEGAEDVR